MEVFTIMKEETRKLLSDALEEIMPVLTKPVSYSDDLILWSNKESLFDSMALVAFVSAVETMILDTLNKDITIVSEKAFSQQHSPFRTMETLGLFIEKLLEEAGE
jgi:hypothetical protein